jgi:hypothetical protein
MWFTIKRHASVLMQILFQSISLISNNFLIAYRPYVIRVIMMKAVIFILDTNTTWNVTNERQLI